LLHAPIGLVTSISSGIDLHGETVAVVGTPAEVAAGPQYALR
jgi:hypothetical protein